MIGMPLVEVHPSRKVSIDKCSHQGSAHWQQSLVRCAPGRGTYCRDRDPGAPQRSCPDHIRSRPASRPSTGPESAGAAALRETPEIEPKMPVSSLPSPKLGQSSAQDQRQSKSRKPSFESNVGGVGPVVADAWDRPRPPIHPDRRIASKGTVRFCSKICYIVAKYATRVSNRKCSSSTSRATM